MRRDEKKLLIIAYIFCIALFTKLAILKNPIDKMALTVGIILCLVIGISHFVIRKFYPDGDKFLLIFACILSIIGIAMIYRINPQVVKDQVANHEVAVKQIEDYVEFIKKKYNPDGTLK